MSKLVLLSLLAAAAWLSAPANAATPAPPMPLPPCVDGVGACPALNELVTGTASGTLGAGGSVRNTTVPKNGVVRPTRPGRPYVSCWERELAHAAAPGRIAGQSRRGAGIPVHGDGGDEYHKRGKQQ